MTTPIKVTSLNNEDIMFLTSDILGKMIKKRKHFIIFLDNHNIDYKRAGYTRTDLIDDLWNLRYKKKWNCHGARVQSSCGRMNN